MNKSNMIKDARVDKPTVYDKFSDLVVVFTTDRKMLVAQYGADGWWHTLGDETFGNVTHWIDHLPWPADFAPDCSLYGGEP